MRISEVDTNNKVIKVEMPLTSPTSKIRIKYKNGHTHNVPIATKKTILENNMFVEWQIGYDMEVTDKEVLLSNFYRTQKGIKNINEITFQSYSNKIKTLYELSEYLYYFYKMDVITKSDIQDLIDYVANIKELIEDKYSIEKSEPEIEEHNGIDFKKSEIKYPHLVYEFKNGLPFLIEVTIKEKQKAIGIQPMLYVCFPVSYLTDENGKSIVGRVAREREIVYLNIDSKMKDFIITTFKIFATLSKAHRHDTLEILLLIDKLKTIEKENKLEKDFAAER